MTDSGTATPSWRPRLRPEVTPVEGPDGPTALRQPRTGTPVKVGRVTRALLGALDGATALEGVLEHATSAGASRADAEEALRALVLLGFVAGAGDESMARLVALDPLSPPLVFLEESRFTCHGSGQCCRTYALGPIDADDVRRLEALDIEGAFPHLGPGPHVQEDEQGRYFLARRDEHCVFLLDDARCGIHAKFGVEAKPKLCRLYPWRAQLTVSGLRIVDTSECSTFASSVGVGEPLRDQLERIRPLLPARHEVHHPLVLLDRAHPCDYGWIVALEADLLAYVADPALDPARTILAVAARAFGFADALARCPLAPGEPDATVAAQLARPLALPVVAPAATEAGLAALREAIRALLEAVEAKGLTQPVIPRFVRLLRAAADLPHGAAPLRAKAGEPAHVAAVLRASAVNAIFGGRLLCEGHLRAGVLRFALVPLLAVLGARLLATERGLERASDRELSEAHLVAGVALRMPSLASALVAVEERAPDAVAAAAGLVRGLLG